MPFAFNAAKRRTCGTQIDSMQHTTRKTRANARLLAHADGDRARLGAEARDLLE
jgi:hypothetical protein